MSELPERTLQPCCVCGKPALWANHDLFITDTPPLCSHECRERRTAILNEILAGPKGDALAEQWGPL